MARSAQSRWSLPHIRRPTPYGACVTPGRGGGLVCGRARSWSVPELTGRAEGGRCQTGRRGRRCLAESVQLCAWGWVGAGSQARRWARRHAQPGWRASRWVGAAADGLAVDDVEAAAGEVAQKAVVEVDEVGTESVAVVAGAMAGVMAECGRRWRRSRSRRGHRWPRPRSMCQRELRIRPAWPFVA